MRNSGKLLILGIMALAVLLAGAGWWFRYAATHRAAEFWGPKAVRLIRDAPVVELVRLPETESTVTHDVSNAPGIVHLRNALLEDRSFHWTSSVGSSGGGWRLSFIDPASDGKLTIRFTDNCRGAVQGGYNGEKPRVISTQPIASGLAEMFREIVAREPRTR